jgi:hypothetical protein
LDQQTKKIFIKFQNTQLTLDPELIAAKNKHYQSIQQKPTSTSQNTRHIIPSSRSTNKQMLGLSSIRYIPIPAHHPDTLPHIIKISGRSGEKEFFGIIQSE